MTRPLRRIEQADTPDARGICDELARIVASPAFRNAPRLSAFLRFIVEMVLAGRGDRIKGYTIAVGALGRGEGFDPQTDPIVRVEAGRLRRALGRFYAGEGRHDPVMIELPRGRYVPNFRARAQGVPAPANGDGPDGCAGFAASRRDEDMRALFEQLMALCRLHVAAMAAEVAAAGKVLDLSQELFDVMRGDACRPAPPLLPTAPTALAMPEGRPNGRKARQIQQAQGAPAARARRSRAGRDRRDAGDDRAHPRGL